jgi:hypothetical protein
MKKALLVLFLIFLSNTAQASGPGYCDTLKSVVAGCVRFANQDSPSGEETFDAYVKQCIEMAEGDYTIAMFGTERAAFKFGKCMTAAGYTLEKREK